MNGDCIAKFVNSDIEFVYVTIDAKMCTTWLSNTKAGPDINSHAAFI